MIEKLTPDPEGGFLDEDEVNWKNRSAYLKQKILPLCDCGNTDALLGYIVEMFRTHVGQDNWATTNSGDLPTMFFLSWATSQDYIEHGANIVCSWITHRGEELLKDIETVLSESSKPISV